MIFFFKLFNIDINTVSTGFTRWTTKIARKTYETNDSPFFFEMYINKLKIQRARVYLLYTYTHTHTYSNVGVLPYTYHARQQHTHVHGTAGKNFYEWNAPIVLVVATSVALLRRFRPIRCGTASTVKLL